MRGIPLHDRAGKIVAHAMVDDVDYARFGHLRWYLHKGYVARTRPHPGGAPRGVLLLHREILGLIPGDGKEGDHRDRNKLNNQRYNLRIVTTRSQNQQNMSSHRDSTSRHRGVSWSATRQKWVAQAYFDGKNHNLGYFDDEDEAAKVAAQVRRTHMPYTQQ